MKKIVMIFVALGVILTAGEVSVDTFKDVKSLQREGMKMQKAYDHGSIYEVEFAVQSRRGIQYINAYITKDKKAVIFDGSGFDLKNMAPLQIPLDVEGIKKGADLVFGSGQKEYFLFTDPECHYCNVFEREWPRIEKDVKIYVYYMPLSHHLEAKDMTYYIMQQKSMEEKATTSIRMAQGDKSYKKAKITKQEKDMFNAKLEKNQAFAQRMGVRGTPSLFDFNGIPVNWPTLVQ